MGVIVPSLLETDIAELQRKVNTLAGRVDLMQLDVMDNTFVPNMSINDPALIAAVDMQFEVHLMINKPSFYYQKWALPNVQRIIGHFEAMENVAHELELMKKTGKEVGVAINPETSTYEIKDYLEQIDLVLIMGYSPGFAGQEFQKDVLEKIKEVKKWSPETKVELDGGANEQNIRLIAEAGADYIISNTTLWGADDPQQQYENLQHLANV